MPLSPKIMMRVYYSSYHLWAARHFADLSKTIEDEFDGRSCFDIRHRAYVTNAVLSSVAFLEAAINELYQDVADAHESYIEPLPERARSSLATVWKYTEAREKRPFSVLEKHQLALELAGANPMDTGAAPYQDASVLVSLRNVLTHFTPRSQGGESQHRIAKQLRPKFAECSLMAGSGNPYFPDKCLGSGCAHWGVRSARSFAEEFFRRMGITPNYERAAFEPRS